ncbi:peptidyl-prolyl cis-trans isomerase FKBP65-like [Arachis stenosperma]|uniref:peptidyl-prolyl cis-trans isomerase FKBP65-like n=1 Tax=Arachis stenosperma TaxID=217475 RepID=UPI0025ACD099|nr:peptidyl-prolyl cis-trans isomerase FKBP65-like [Arachis stenosperma]
MQSYIEEREREVAEREAAWRSPSNTPPSVITVAETGTDSPNFKYIILNYLRNRETRVIEQFEPGVYVTLIIKPTGVKMFKRVGFSVICIEHMSHYKSAPQQGQKRGRSRPTGSGKKQQLTSLDAFGENGRPASGDEGVVPLNASLQIDLEWISWKAISDITKDKNVLKKTLKEGEGYERPNDGAVVQVKLIGKLQDGTIFVKKGHDDEQPFEFKIDEEQVIDGLDKAVMNMKKGEVALVTIHLEYAFGSSGSTQELATVPPNSNVYYEVELVSFVKESWDLNTPEKIEAAGKKKEEGNALFKVGKYERASKRYEKSAVQLQDKAQHVLF